MNQAALQQYKAIGVQGGIMDANPHQLISMLITGAMDRVASARGSIMRGEISRKGELLSSVIAIVDGLRASLDHKAGGEISGNLASLYDYMEQLLMQANMASDIAPLEEVSAILMEIRAGWEAIPINARVV